MGILDPADPNIRMEAYYYGFQRTGIGIIDEILSAVAVAGKGYHHTEEWSEPIDWLGNKSYADLIQLKADEAAEAIRRSEGYEYDSEI